MALRLGDIAPDFEQDSSAGRIRFHEWLGNGWGVLFSHPADFTPVCTTELRYTAKLAGEFARRNVRVIASLQLTDGYSVATPVSWKQGEDVIIIPSLKDPDVLKQKFPKGYRIVRPYLRYTPQPDR
ncbi:MAG: redoxin domain-containing protein [Betaproteobacteria bacterium]|nr:redoxin domain-containing protein [Betaproteobacteria bacterium]